MASLARQRDLSCLHEYVFIDDGSSDNSVEILRSLLPNLGNARLIIQENQGPAKATNNGVKAAIGEYIKLVDGDDILPSSASNIMLMLIEAQKAQLITGKLGT